MNIIAGYREHRCSIPVVDEDGLVDEKVRSCLDIHCCMCGKVGLRLVYIFLLAEFLGEIGVQGGQFIDFFAIQKLSLDAFAPHNEDAVVSIDRVYECIGDVRSVENEVTDFSCRARLMKITERLEWGGCLDQRYKRRIGVADGAEMQPVAADAEIVVVLKARLLLAR